MNEKKLLAVGIDPGITTAYAILDLEGKVLKLNSAKQLDVNKIISDVLGYGKVVLVGTDKAKAPSLVLAFATKMGARVISPESDLGIAEKKEMSFRQYVKDDHQIDALASALFALRKVSQLLKKIDIIAEKSKKPYLRNRVKELVISKKISIKSAIELLEKDYEEEKIISNVVYERKLVEDDFLKLYEKNKRLEFELKILKRYSENLSNRIKNLEEKRPLPVSKAKKGNDFKDVRIRVLENSIKQKSSEFDKVKILAKSLREKISRINEYYILKKLNNLGSVEFSTKSKILGIKKGDILLVDDPNIFSQDIIDSIKDKIFLVVNKKPISGKVNERLPFAFISAQNFRIEEEKYFAFIDKKHFDYIKSKMEWAKKIINDYKQERLLSR